jgi:hypothetical protein
MASPLVRAETKRTAEAIFDTISEKEKPVSAGDIAKEFNLPRGRHTDIASGLKYLIRQDKIVKLGEGRGSTYISTANHLKPAPLTETEILEQAHLPAPPGDIKPKKAKAIPVHMVEVPKATLKLVVKAVMQCCTPMDNALLRATMQCMEKLI